MWSGPGPQLCPWPHRGPHSPSQEPPLPGPLHELLVSSALSVPLPHQAAEMVTLKHRSDRVTFLSTMTTVKAKLVTIVCAALCDLFLASGLSPFMLHLAPFWALLCIPRST